MSTDTVSAYNLVLKNSTKTTFQSYWFSHQAEGETISYGGGVSLEPGQQSSPIPITVIKGRDDSWTVSLVNAQGSLYSTGLLVKDNVASGLPQGTTVTLNVPAPPPLTQFAVYIDYPGYKAKPLPLSLFGQPTAD